MEKDKHFKVLQVEYGVLKKKILDALSLENVLVNFNEHDAKKQILFNEIKLKIAKAFTLRTDKEKNPFLSFIQNRAKNIIDKNVKEIKLKQAVEM